MQQQYKASAVCGRITQAAVGTMKQIDVKGKCKFMDIKARRQFKYSFWFKLIRVTKKLARTELRSLNVPASVKVFT